MSTRDDGRGPCRRPPHGSLNAAERSAQAITLALAAEPGVPDDSYQAASAELGQQGVVDSIHLATLYTGTCVLLNAFEVSVP